MQQVIINFDQDELGDWRAILACGHRQHVRHNPPFANRPWVLTEEGRSRFLGATLECQACDEGEPVGDGQVSAGALEAAYARFREELDRFIRRQAQASDAAGDMLREAFLAIHDRVGSSAESDRLDELVYDTTRDVIIGRQHRLQPLTGVPDWFVPQVEEGSNVPVKPGNLVRTLFDCLPGNLRQTLILIEDRGLQPEELAGWLDISVAEAGSRVRLGRAMLREALLDCCHFELGRLDLAPPYQSLCAVCTAG
jgi:DNA-directed RNA polymerase specialized sigma24 family protein